MRQILAFPQPPGALPGRTARAPPPAPPAPAYPLDSGEKPAPLAPAAAGVPKQSRFSPFFGAISGYLCRLRRYSSARRRGGSQPDPAEFRFIVEEAVRPLVAPHAIGAQAFGEDGLRRLGSPAPPARGDGRVPHQLRDLIS